TTLFRSPGLRQGAARIDRGAAEPDLEVEVRAGRVAGGADEAESGARGNGLTAVGVDLRKVRVERPNAVAVEHDDQVPPAAAGEGGVDDAPRSGCGHWCSLRRDDVDPLVEAVAARAERRADRALQRPGKRQRAGCGRLAEGGDRARACDSVRCDAGPALEVTQCAVGVVAETAVDRGRGE